MTRATCETSVSVAITVLYNIFNELREVSFDTDCYTKSADD